MTGRDLIDMAHGPRGGSVVLPVHDVERTVPLRRTSRAGRRHAVDSGLRSLDDLLDVVAAQADDRDERSVDDRFLRRADLDRAGWSDVSWTASDSRARCGRHRA